MLSNFRRDQGGAVSTPPRPSVLYLTTTAISMMNLLCSVGAATACCDVSRREACLLCSWRSLARGRHRLLDEDRLPQPRPHRLLVFQHSWNVHPVHQTSTCSTIFKVTPTKQSGCRTVAPLSSTTAAVGAVITTIRLHSERGCPSKTARLCLFSSYVQASSGNQGKGRKSWWSQRLSGLAMKQTTFQASISPCHERAVEYAASARST